MRTSSQYEERNHSVQRFDFEIGPKVSLPIERECAAIIDWCIVALLLIGAVGILFWSVTA